MPTLNTRKGGLRLHDTSEVDLGEVWAAVVGGTSSSTKPCAMCNRPLLAQSLKIGHAYEMEEKKPSSSHQQLSNNTNNTNKKASSSNSGTSGSTAVTTTTQKKKALWQCFPCFEKSNPPGTVVLERVHPHPRGQESLVREYLGEVAASMVFQQQPKKGTAGAKIVDPTSTAAMKLQRWWRRARRLRRQDEHVVRLHTLTKYNASAAFLQQWWRGILQGRGFNEGRRRRKSSIRFNSDQKRKKSSINSSSPPPLLRLKIKPRATRPEGIRMKNAAETVWEQQEIALRGLNEKIHKEYARVRDESSPNPSNSQKNGGVPVYRGTFADRIEQLLGIKNNAPKVSSSLTQEEQELLAARRKMRLDRAARLPLPKDQPYRSHTHPEVITNPRYLPKYTSGTQATVRTVTKKIKKQVPRLVLRKPRSSIKTVASGADNSKSLNSAVPINELVEWRSVHDEDEDQQRGTTPIRGSTADDDVVALPPIQFGGGVGGARTPQPKKVKPAASFNVTSVASPKADTPPPRMSQSLPLGVDQQWNTDPNLHPQPWRTERRRSHKLPPLPKLREAVGK